MKHIDLCKKVATPNWYLFDEKGNVTGSVDYFNAEINKDKVLADGTYVDELYVMENDDFFSIYSPDIAMLQLFEEIIECLTDGIKELKQLEEIKRKNLIENGFNV